MTDYSVKRDEKRNTVTLTQGKTSVVYTLQAWDELEARDDHEEVVARALAAEK